MTASKGTDRPRFLRRTYLVDRPMQLTVVFGVVCVLMTMAVLFTGGLYVLTDDQFLGSLTASEVRNLILRLNAAYFLFTAVGMVFVVIMLTHRIAGPARVLGQALDGMCKGDFTRRTRIRRKDYLQSLATSASRLAEHLSVQELERGEIVAEVSGCLDRGDVEGAREALGKLVPAGERNEAEVPVGSP